MNYFKDCEDEIKAKSIYRRYAKQLHPDRGGTHEAMSELTRQYAVFIKNLSSLHKRHIKVDVPNKYKEYFDDLIMSIMQNNTQKIRSTTEELITYASIEILKDVVKNLEKSKFK